MNKLLRTPKSIPPSKEDRDYSYSMYIHGELVRREHLGFTDNLGRSPHESYVCMSKLNDSLWLVVYAIEQRIEEFEHFLTEKAAHIEVDRIIASHKHFRRWVCSCPNCYAAFDCKGVGAVCPMCGTNNDGHTTLGWDSWDLDPADYAAQMHASWARHLIWRRKNGLYPEWYKPDKDLRMA